MLANAAHVKNVPGRKTDVNDATWLADLMAQIVPNLRDRDGTLPADRGRLLHIAYCWPLPRLGFATAGSVPHAAETSGFVALTQ